MTTDPRLRDRLHLATESFELDSDAARAGVAEGVRTRHRNRRVAVFVVVAVIVGLLAYAGIGVPLDRTVPGGSPSPQVVTPPPSPNDAAAKFAGDLLASSGRSVSYAVLEASDFKVGSVWAPTILLDLGGPPRSHNDLEAIRTALRKGGDHLLERSGFAAYALTGTPRTVLTVIPLRDYELFPGPQAPPTQRAILNSVVHLLPATPRTSQ
jgi:hypothetical protein